MTRWSWWSAPRGPVLSTGPPATCRESPAGTVRRPSGTAGTAAHSRDGRGRPRERRYRHMRSDPVQRVVCPGSFDPVTNGHLDIIGRAAGLYDEVVVAVLINITKHSLFTVDERVDMLRQVTKGYGNVRIERFHGLLVDFCAANGITAVVKGLRAVSDFEYEMQMAQMNYRLAKVETLFMTTNPLYSFLRSSLVKEIAKYGGDVSGLVPELVLDRLRTRLTQE